MSNLDELRSAAQDDDPFESLDAVLVREEDEGKLFGLTAIERMFLSMGLFGIVLVGSFLLLIVTDSIAI